MSDEARIAGGDERVGDTGLREVGGLEGGIQNLVRLCRQWTVMGVERNTVMEKFTREYVKTAQEYHPDKNILAVCTQHETEFEGFVDGSPSHYSLDFGLANGVTYSCYIFEKGKLAKHGDGGFNNWCFVGNYERFSDGNTEFVHFNPIEREIPPFSRNTGVICH
jgi:hypothetical protein